MEGFLDPFRLCVSFDVPPKSKKKEIFSNLFEIGHHQLRLGRIVSDSSWPPHEVPSTISDLRQPGRHAHTPTDLRNVVAEASLWSIASPRSINRTEKKYSVHFVVLKNVAN